MGEEHSFVTGSMQCSEVLILKGLSDSLNVLSAKLMCVPDVIQQFGQLLTVSSW